METIVYIVKENFQVLEADFELARTMIGVWFIIKLEEYDIYTTGYGNRHRLYKITLYDKNGKQTIPTLNGWKIMAVKDGYFTWGKLNKYSEVYHVTSANVYLIRDPLGVIQRVSFSIWNIKRDVIPFFVELSQFNSWENYDLQFENKKLIKENEALKQTIETLNEMIKSYEQRIEKLEKRE